MGDGPTIEKKGPVAGGSLRRRMARLQRWLGSLHPTEPDVPHGTTHLGLVKGSRNLGFLAGPAPAPVKLSVADYDST
jgi:hypothetical protein